MRVLVTGASGHIAAALVPELVRAGHEVVGLARSDSAAKVVEERGARVVRADLADLDTLRAAASEVDGVVHLAFDHAAMAAGNLAAAAETDLAAAAALADGLGGGDAKAFVGTSGTLMLALAGMDRVGSEDDAIDGGYRVGTENYVIGLAAAGIRSSVVRLPPVVHSLLDLHGFVPMLIGTARATGRSGYVGEGSNRWPAAHTLDVARLYRLALEAAPAGSRLHAVDDEGIPLRRIAEVIAAKLGVPTATIPSESVPEHFGPLAFVIALDNPTSSARTRKLLGWEPEQPGLLADLDRGHYFAAS